MDFLGSSEKKYQSLQSLIFYFFSNSKKGVFYIYSPSCLKLIGFQSIFIKLFFRGKKALYNTKSCMHTVCQCSYASMLSVSYHYPLCFVHLYRAPSRGRICTIRQTMRGGEGHRRAEREHPSWRKGPSHCQICQQPWSALPEMLAADVPADAHHLPHPIPKARWRTGIRWRLSELHRTHATHGSLLSVRDNLFLSSFKPSTSHHLSIYRIHNMKSR